MTRALASRLTRWFAVAPELADRIDTGIAAAVIVVCVVML